MAITALPVAGYGRLTVGKPRRWGQVDRLAWGLEHSFPRTSDRLPEANPDEPRVAGSDAWTYTKTSTIPGLRALTLAPSPKWEDHWPKDCANDEELRTILGYGTRTAAPHSWDQLEGTWVPLAPSGYKGYTWIGTENVNYEGIAKVRTVHDWGWEQSVMVLFYSWAPTWTGSRRPMFSFTIGRTLEGVGGLKVVFPMFAEGLETDEDPRPRVEADDGTILAWLDEPSLTDSTADMGPRLWAFTIRTVEPGVYFVSVGDGGEALITAEGLEMGMAPLEVEVVGFGCAFTVAPIEYALEGTAEKATESVWPDWIGDQEVEVRTREYLWDEVLTATTTVTAEAQNVPVDLGLPPDDPGRFSTTQVKLDLTTDQPRYSPVVYLAQETHGPILLERDLSAMEVEQFVSRMTAYETPDGRASMASLMVRNITGSLDAIRENSWAEVWTGHQWCPGAGPEQAWFQEYPLMAGFLWVDEAGQFGDAIPTGDEFWHVIVYPWSSRLAAKRMVNFGEMSFAGWPLEDLVYTLLKAQGLPEELILFELPEGTSLDDLKVPCARKWERRHAYPYDAGFIESFDELLASVGCRWRCTRTGEIAIFQPMPWNGIPDWVLDDADPSWVDLMEARRITTDALTMSNVVFHVGADPYGSLLMGMVLDDASLQVTDHPMFVGEDRWSVAVDLGNEDPEATALMEYERGHRYQAVVRWDWVAHPHWEPGHRVELQIDGGRIPRGTVVEILGKMSRVDGDAGEYVETVEAGVVRWP